MPTLRAQTLSTTPHLRAIIPTAGSTSSAPGGREWNRKPEGEAQNPADYAIAESVEGSLKDENDWMKSFHGLSVEPFKPEISQILQAPINMNDVEIKPDGIIYLPEIKYRRVLNKAFGPGGWGLAPRGETSRNPKNISREYALICHGRFVSQARGEQDYFALENIPTAAEGCKSNALMRCCKDLGIASELWDPIFIRKFKAQFCMEVMVEGYGGKRFKRWRKRDQPPLDKELK
jgi:hypothetical protein